MNIKKTKTLFTLDGNTLMAFEIDLPGDESAAGKVAP